MTYYPINEDTAKRANDANSFRDYKPGSATAAYRAEVDKAAALAEKQKAKVDPMHHDKLDGLLDRYAHRLADYYNDYYRNEAACPSILITGGANFPVAKKEKQNARPVRRRMAAAAHKERPVCGQANRGPGTCGEVIPSAKIIPEREGQQHGDHGNKKASRVSAGGKSKGWICQPWHGVYRGSVLAGNHRAA